MKKREYEEIKIRQCEVNEIRGIKRHPISIVCENIRSLFNVGSIFRTADGLRVEQLYLCGYTGFPPRKEIDKVALGAVENVPWEYRENTAALLRELTGKGIQVVALEHTENSVNFQEFEYRFPVAVVLGHEYEGITQETLDYCPFSVEIPMHGIKQSLNVSTAFGVIGYELLRQLGMLRADGTSVNTGA